MRGVKERTEAPGRRGEERLRDVHEAVACGRMGGNPVAADVFARPTRADPGLRPSQRSLGRARVTPPVGVGLY